MHFFKAWPKIIKAYLIQNHVVYDGHKLTQIFFFFLDSDYNSI